MSDEGQFLSFIKPSNLIVASVRTLSSTADIVELKCKDAFHPVDEAQLLSHLRLLNIPLGLLINFHVVLLKDGIKRMVNYYDENLGQPESDALNRKGR